LKKAFSPEFLNRIDDVVLFNSLEKKDIHQIIDIELAHLYSRIEKMGYKIELTVPAKDFIADKGYDAQYGARPLKRAIQKYLEDPMAEEIINATMSEGDTLLVDYDKKADNVVVNVKKGKKPKAAAKPEKAPKKKDDTDDAAK